VFEKKPKKGVVVKKKVLFCLIVVVLFAGKAYAGRPFSTEDGYVSKKDEFQVELSVESVDEKFDENSWSVNITPIYGVTDLLEISADLSYAYIDNAFSFGGEKGLADIGVCLKYLVLNESESMPSLVAKTYFKFDNGSYSKGIGTGSKEASLEFAMSKEFGKLVFHSNVGYVFTFDKEEECISDYIIYGIGCEYKWNDKLNFIFELFCSSDSCENISSFSKHSVEPKIGAIYFYNEKISFDFFLMKSYVDWDEQSFSCGTGITFLF